MERVKESNARLKILEDQQESQMREIRRQEEVLHLAFMYAVLLKLVPQVGVRHVPAHPTEIKIACLSLLAWPEPILQLAQILRSAPAHTQHFHLSCV
jgi:hypothetical protein